MIPKNSKKVFSGEIFDVYQWDQKMYDGSTEVFESVLRNDTAEVIALKDGKILIQLQEQPHKPKPFRCLPGGRIESGEDPLEGAKRELLEETGCVSEHWIHLHSAHVSSKVIWHNFLYVARDCKQVAEQNLDVGEKIIMEEVTFEELLDLADAQVAFGEKPLLRLDPILRTILVRAKYDSAHREALRAQIFG